MNFSRRRFLKQCGAFAGLFLADRIGLPFSASADDNSADFEILVAGDSVIWGQGLREEDKFYFLIKEWLENEVLSGLQKVNLKVKAHSGATILLSPRELTARRRAGDDINKIYCPEVNVSFPSVKRQIEIAVSEYDKEKRTADLILLNGGITDIGIANVLNPFFSEKKFRRLVRQFCFTEMQSLLANAAGLFPKAKIIVIGYFPIVSTKTKVNKISRFVLKIIKFPHALRFLITNGLSKQFVKIIRKQMAKRSRLWFEESNRETLAAIKNVNSTLGEERIFFVKSPITEETCYATEKTLLWQLGKNDLPEDAKFELDRKNVGRYSKN